MKRTVWLCIGVVFCLSPVRAQQGHQQAAISLGGATSTASVSSATVGVPPLVNFSGVLTDGNGEPLTGVVGVTFCLYKDSQGGAPLWMETQNVEPDKTGHYSVMLGSTTSQGLPSAIFVSGEAHWLGVEPQGQAEQPRVLLLSVPYALKAADAETMGGLPPSAFVLATAPNNGSGTSPSAVIVPSNPTTPTTPLALGGSGTTNFLPIWTNSTTLGNSILFQSTSSNVGIGTQTPAAKLDVKGGAMVRGGFSLPAQGTATATAGFISHTLNLTASAFNSSTSKAVNQTFRWQAEPVANNTTAPSGKLNLLFGTGASTPTETGLSISNNGLLTFASGQAFPGTGTITGVTAGTDLSGGGTTGNVTLNLDLAATDARYAQLATSNTFTDFSGLQKINGALSVVGYVQTLAEFIANPNPLCHNFGLVALVNSACSDVALEGDGFNTFINRPSGAVISFLEANSTTEATLKSGGEFDIFASSGRALNAFNNSSIQTLELHNGATPSNGHFTEAQFDANNKVTFFTDTLGDTTAIGTKNAAVPLRSGQMVKVFSMESPEVWFEDFGSGLLTGGITTISLDSKFTETVNLSSGYHVFLTPKGDCKGLFVTSETNQGFEVRELSGGQSSVAFDYRIVAHRNGYEAQRLPVAKMPVADPKAHVAKLPVVHAGARAAGPFSAKLNPADAVINKKK